MATNACYNASNDTDITYTKIKVIFDVYIVGFLCVFGISGNIISILVLGRDSIVKRTTGLLLQMLALADALYLVTCLLFQTLQTVAVSTDWSPTLCYWFLWIKPYVLPPGSVAQTAAVWLVVVVTADRYVAICRPLHAPQYSTTSRARKAVTMVWALSLIYNLPRFFERTTILVYDPVTNTSYPDCVKTELREDPTYFLVYKTCLYFVVRVCVPLAALAFFNTRLIQAIKASQRIQNRTTDCYKKERYTLTLVVVVFVFVICETPDLLLRVWLSLGDYVESLPSDDRVLRYCNIVTNLCLTLNSCVNFVIYCFLGQKFRSILKQMLCRFVSTHGGRRARLYYSQRHRPDLSQTNDHRIGDESQNDIAEEMSTLVSAV